MTQSALATRVIPHHNKFHSRQGNGVTRVIQHHWAGPGGDARLSNPTQQASANYLIFNDGTIAIQVPEEYRAWTSGSFEADGNAITIEVENYSFQKHGDDNHPDSWAISDEAYNAIVALIADIARRYGWGSINDSNYMGHRQFNSTACPGGYIWARMGDIRAWANKALKGGAAPAPAAPKPAAPAPAQKSIAQLADEVMAGKHGNGAQRQASLGGNYNAVQNEINRRAGLSASAPTAPAPQKSIAQLADEVMAGKHGNGADRQRSLGANYNAVQNEINQRAGVGAAPAAKSISQLADEVLAGKHGDGAQRQASLGGNYNAVQAEINRRYGV